ncbi:hypothetical protein GCM10027262_22300 [Nocardia tengchongensis]
MIACTEAIDFQSNPASGKPLTSALNHGETTTHMASQLSALPAGDAPRALASAIYSNADPAPTPHENRLVSVHCRVLPRVDVSLDGARNDRCRQAAEQIF